MQEVVTEDLKIKTCAERTTPNLAPEKSGSTVFTLPNGRFLQAAESAGRVRI
jgi:hypothetical protein